MAFVRFILPKNRKADVKMTKTSIILSEEAINKFALSDAEFVGLYFDDETQRIGIEALTTKDKNSVAISKYKDDNDKIIKASEFFKGNSISSEYKIDGPLNKGQGNEEKIISFHISKSVQPAKPKRSRSAKTPGQDEI